ncbi:MAG TPA: hypothetical protein VGB18_06655 [Candidatus Thermoplasmatota archaeon]
MLSLNRTFALSVALFLLVPASAHAQGDGGGWLSEFKFDQLRFVFWPGGVENRQDSDGKGSAIIVQADKVAITEWDALDVRHCIDGDDTWCSYPEVAQLCPNSANTCRNGQVEVGEIQSFQTIAQVVLRSKIEKVDQLADTLETNITVGGLQAKSVKIMKLVIHGAEGVVDSNETIFADVEAKATYENDKDATSHVIHIGELKLKDDGFIYKQAIWKIGPSGWKYDAGATAPDAGKKFMSDAGYFSSQDQFEQLSVGGVDLHIVKAEGAGRSPGVAPVLVLAVLVAVVLVVNRRK